MDRKRLEDKLLSKHRKIIANQNTHTVQDINKLQKQFNKMRQDIAKGN